MSCSGGSHSGSHTLLLAKYHKKYTVDSFQANRNFVTPIKLKFFSFSSINTNNKRLGGQCLVVEEATMVHIYEYWQNIINI